MFMEATGFITVAKSYHGGPTKSKRGGPTNDLGQGCAGKNGGAQALNHGALPAGARGNIRIRIGAGVDFLMSAVTR